LKKSKKAIVLKIFLILPFVIFLAVVIIVFVRKSSVKPPSSSKKLEEEGLVRGEKLFPKNLTREMEEEVKKREGKITIFFSLPKTSDKFQKDLKDAEVMKLIYLKSFLASYFYNEDNFD